MYLKQVFISLLILTMSDASKDRVKCDADSFGGETMRGWDHTLSKNLGGYRSGQEPGIYGKYVEPAIHAAVHTVRGIEGDRFAPMSGQFGVRMNQAEWARAKDEIKTVGSGLLANDNKYQEEFKAKRGN